MRCEFWITNNTQCCNYAEVAQMYYHSKTSKYFAPNLCCSEHTISHAPENMTPNWSLHTLTLEEYQLRRVKEAL